MKNNRPHPLRVGRYSIAACIGHGALGPVHAAIDDTSGRHVAVRLGRAGDPRVHQQAKLTGQVAHPNIVSVLDLGEETDGPFVVMERLDGASLAAGAAVDSLDRRLDVMRQVCDGLQAAHECGVVHGAIKPAHVFRHAGGVVKLLDFGGDGRTDAYAAPEQTGGGRADERSDVFSAGATFHFLLTSKAPFVSAASAAYDQPPAIASADAPEELSRTLLRALEKDPGRRHASINLLRAEIDQARQRGQGDRHRIAMAAFERYRHIDELLAERRALGRRLGVAEVERHYDAGKTRLAAVFPELAGAGLDVRNLGDLGDARVAAALAELQVIHNDVAAEVSVLRIADGGRR